MIPPDIKTRVRTKAVPHIAPYFVFNLCALAVSLKTREITRHSGSITGIGAARITRLAVYCRIATLPRVSDGRH
jgi:hypothetical protein